MKNITTFLFVCFITITLLSCWKKSRFQCETWEYYDECTAKVAGLQNCNKEANKDGNFCDSDMQGITAGGTRIIYEDADKKIVRHFIRKK